MKGVMIGMLALTVAMAVGAQTTINVGNPQWGSGYSVENGVITITSSGEYILTGTTTTNRVVVGQGVAATITLSNVSITSATNSPFVLDAAGCNVSIELVGDNSLASTVEDSNVDGTEYCPAMRVEGSASVSISGSGSLTANGGSSAAAIGAGWTQNSQGIGHSVGNIVINSGTITAIGGYQAAGLGGGNRCSGGSINISGGVITATGGRHAAGIGGGFHGTVSNISISGGVLLVIGGGQDGATDIGGGGDADNGSISISGGSIFTCGNNGVGIGRSAGAQGSINISGGTIVTGIFGTANTTTITAGAIIANAIATSSFGSAAVLTGVIVTEALARKMFANTPIIASEGEDEDEGEGNTIIIERPGNTVYLHDTTTITITDPAVIVHDTLRDFTEVRDTAYFSYNIHDTTYVRDTIYKDRIVRDTLRLTLRDTVINLITLPVHETISLPAFYDVYTIVNNVTGDESPVEDTRIDLVPVSGSDNMFYLHGIRQNTPFAVYDTSGALVLKADKMPIPLTASGVFIVAQEGKYYKFVK